MGSLFSRKPQKESRVTEQDRAVLQLKQQRDKLKQYQRKLESRLEHERDVARQLLQNQQKEKALLILKKKRFQESLIGKTEQQLDNIDQLIHDIEFAQVEQQVVKGLEAGNAALQEMHRLVSIEDVERIMEDTRESVEYQREIDALLSAGGLSAQDESDVMAELEQILQTEAPPPLNLSDVPSSEPPPAAAAAHRRTEPARRERTAAEALTA